MKNQFDFEVVLSAACDYIDSKNAFLRTYGKGNYIHDYNRPMEKAYLRMDKHDYVLIQLCNAFGLNYFDVIRAAKTYLEFYERGNTGYISAEYLFSKMCD